MTACQEMIVDNPLLVISSVIWYNNLNALSLPTFKKQFEIDCFYLTSKKLKSVYMNYNEAKHFSTSNGAKSLYSFLLE